MKFRDMTKAQLLKIELEARKARLGLPDALPILPLKAFRNRDGRLDGHHLNSTWKAMDGAAYSSTHLKYIQDMCEYKGLDHGRLDTAIIEQVEAILGGVVLGRDTHYRNHNPKDGRTGHRYDNAVMHGRHTNLSEVKYRGVLTDSYVWGRTNEAQAKINFVALAWTNGAAWALQGKSRLFTAIVKGGKLRAVEVELDNGDDYYLLASFHKNW